MARGRGRGNFHIISDQLGFSRQERPEAVLQPPLLFPEVQNQPLPFTKFNKDNDFLQNKQELRNCLNESDFYVMPIVVKNMIARYSDRYREKSRGSVLERIDASRFPSELRPVKKQKIVKQGGSKLKKRRLDDVGIAERLNKLEQIEKMEIESEDAEKEKDKDDDDDENEKRGEDNEEYEIEEEEDDDYMQSYFDNGENYVDNEDDNLDEEATF